MCNFLGNTISHSCGVLRKAVVLLYNFSSERMISIEEYGHGSFWMTVNWNLSTLQVHQPVENLVFCCKGPEIQFVQCCHTQPNLQELSMVISWGLRSPTVSLEEFKFVIGSRIILLQLWRVEFVSSPHYEGGGSIWEGSP